MVEEKTKALDYILSHAGRIDKIREHVWVNSFKILEDLSESCGLSADDIDSIIGLVISRKLSNPLIIKLIDLLAPEKQITNRSVAKILSWYFTNKSTLTVSVEKCVLRWLIGIVHYKLVDSSVPLLYYLSFLFYIHSKPSMAPLVLKLVYQLTEPQHARRANVKSILSFITRYGKLSEAQAVLSLMKSYRPDVIPENIPSVVLDFNKLTLNKNLTSAYKRNELSATQGGEQTYNSALLPVLYDGKSKHLRRLIPLPENISFTSSIDRLRSNTVSIAEIKSLQSLTILFPRLSIASESMAYLANSLGHHVISFTDHVTRNRFMVKLYYTLHRVFILRLEQYRKEEKQFLLHKIWQLEEYMQKGIAVVTLFLEEYLLLWDGFQFQSEILALIEWIVYKKDDVSHTIFRPLRQIFRSGDVQVKCAILNCMGNLLRNLVIEDMWQKRDIPESFLSEFRETDIVDSFTTVVSFSNSLISEALNYCTEDCKGPLVRASLDFHELVLQCEDKGDLPTQSILPLVLVYNCIFSFNLVNLERVSSLILGYLNTTRERLYRNGLVEDFKTDLELQQKYAEDWYGCLWVGLDELQKFSTPLTADKYLLGRLELMTQVYGPDVLRLLTMRNNLAIRLVQEESDNWESVANSLLATHFPSILELKSVIERENF